MFQISRLDANEHKFWFFFIQTLNNFQCNSTDTMKKNPFHRNCLVFPYSKQFDTRSPTKKKNEWILTSVCENFFNYFVPDEEEGDVRRINSCHDFINVHLSKLRWLPQDFWISDLSKVPNNLSKNINLQISIFINSCLFFVSFYYWNFYHVKSKKESSCKCWYYCRCKEAIPDRDWRSSKWENNISYQHCVQKKWICFDCIFYFNKSDSTTRAIFRSFQYIRFRRSCIMQYDTGDHHGPFFASRPARHAW
jgi:hypothetical protein